MSATLTEQFAESARLEQAIRENLKGLGYGVQEAKSVSHGPDTRRTH